MKLALFLVLARQLWAFTPVPRTPVPRTATQGLREQKKRARATVVKGGATAWATTVAPTIGAVVANAMFFSSLPAVLDARKDQKLGDLNPVPWAFIFTNCVAWLHYSYVIQNPYAFLSNCFGALLGLFYVSTGIALGDTKQRAAVEKIVLLFTGLHVAASFFSTFILQTMAQRQLLTGYIANFVLVIFYGAPLSTLRDVLKTKSAASIYAPLSLLSGINGALWVTYGLAISDLFIAIPNAAGLALAIVQLTFKAMFR